MNLLTVNQTAKRLGFSGSMVRRLLRQRKLNGFKMDSGFWVIYDDEKLDNFT